MRELTKTAYSLYENNMSVDSPFLSIHNLYLLNDNVILISDS
jgi:hypothetical protein